MGPSRPGPVQCSPGALHGTQSRATQAPADPAPPVSLTCPPSVLLTLLQTHGCPHSSSCTAGTLSTVGLSPPLVISSQHVPTASHAQVFGEMPHSEWGCSAALFIMKIFLSPPHPHLLLHLSPYGMTPFNFLRSCLFFLVCVSPTKLYVDSAFC